MRVKIKVIEVSPDKQVGQEYLLSEVTDIPRILSQLTGNPIIIRIIFKFGWVLDEVLILGRELLKQLPQTIRYLILADHVQARSYMPDNTIPALRNGLVVNVLQKQPNFVGSWLVLAEGNFIPLFYKTFAHDTKLPIEVVSGSDPYQVAIQKLTQTTQ